MGAVCRSKGTCDLQPGQDASVWTKAPFDIHRLAESYRQRCRNKVVDAREKEADGKEVPVKAVERPERLLQVPGRGNPERVL